MPQRKYNPVAPHVAEAVERNRGKSFDIYDYAKSRETPPEIPPSQLYQLMTMLGMLPMREPGYEQSYLDPANWSSDPADDSLLAAYPGDTGNILRLMNHRKKLYSEGGYYNPSDSGTVRNRSLR